MSLSAASALALISSSRVIPHPPLPARPCERRSTGNIPKDTILCHGYNKSKINRGQEYTH